jgi:PKD repeat protein
MAEEKATGKISGWIKALFTSLFGLVSGAALMYLTPLVNNVIKPGKPVPNFAQQASGLTVTFNNRSTGGTHGWWDFGDGSALEPYEPEKDTITHTYPRASDYNVKLSLQNLLGEESERTVAVKIIDGAATASLPKIEAFVVQKLSGDNAPATFKIISSVKNAKVIAWDLGDDKITTETTVSPEGKFVTLNEPGYYNLRLVAFNGDQHAERSQQVFVGMGDNTKPTATLKVVYDGVQVEQKADRETIVLGWDPKQQGATCLVSRELPVAPGWTIADVKYEPPSRDLVHGLKLEVTPDRTRVRATAEMLKPKTMLTGKSLPPPHCGVRVDLVLVRRSGPVSRAGDPVSFELTAPGSTMLPLPGPPAGLEVQAKRIALEIRDGTQLIWNSPGLPNAATVAVKNRPMRVTALEQSGQLRVDVVDAAKNVIPVSRPN